MAPGLLERPYDIVLPDGELPLSIRLKEKHPQSPYQPATPDTGRKPVSGVA